MFSFLRNIFALAGFVLVIGSTYLVYKYDTVDPCRILAMENSQLTIEELSTAFGGDGSSLGVADAGIESIYLALTAQYSTQQCGQKLTDMWWGQLSGNE